MLKSKPDSNPKTAKRETAAVVPASQRNIDADGIPLEYRCPICFKLMERPVLLPCGRSAEREEVEEWFRRGNRTNPLNSEPLEPGFVLIDNLNLKDAIDRFKALNKERQEKGSLAVADKGSFQSVQKAYEALCLLAQSGEEYSLAVEVVKELNSLLFSGSLNVTPQDVSQLSSHVERWVNALQYLRNLEVWKGGDSLVELALDLQACPERFTALQNIGFALQRKTVVVITDKKQLPVCDACAELATAINQFLLGKDLSFQSGRLTEAAAASAVQSNQGLSPRILAAESVASQPVNAPAFFPARGVPVASERVAAAATWPGELAAELANLYDGLTKHTDRNQERNRLCSTIERYLKALNALVSEPFTIAQLKHILGVIQKCIGGVRFQTTRNCYRLVSGGDMVQCEKDERAEYTIEVSSAAGAMFKNPGSFQVYLRKMLILVEGCQGQLESKTRAQPKNN